MVKGLILLLRRGFQFCSTPVSLRGSGRVTEAWVARLSQLRGRDSSWDEKSCILLCLKKYIVISIHVPSFFHGTVYPIMNIHSYTACASVYMKLCEIRAFYNICNVQNSLETVFRGRNGLFSACSQSFARRL